MNALLLPGNSTRHAEWIEQLADALSPYFDTTKTQHYRHWKTGEQAADVAYEISAAKDNAAQLEPYCIIAKSIGCVIAAKGTADGLLHPEKLILLGVPINGGAPREAFAKFLRTISVPVVIIQNTSDPLGSFDNVKIAFENVGNHISFVEMPGDTHDYIDFESIAKLV